MRFKYFTEIIKEGNMSVDLKITVIYYCESWTYLQIDFMDGVTEEDYIRYAYMMETKLSKLKELEE